MNKRSVFITLLACVCIVVAASFSLAADSDGFVSRWSKEINKKNDLGANLTVRATYYSAEYIEAVLQREAKRNMWTAAELEDYKYNFLKNLRLEEFIPVHLEIENNGPMAHMSPFNEMILLWIGKKNHAPVEYEQRFNFPLQGKRDGLVFFPRFDKKTGKPLLQGVKNVRLVLRSAALPVLDGKGDLSFIWEIAGDDTSKLYSGQAANRMELERLITRVEKLNKEKKEIESLLAEKNKELNEINARIKELEK